MKTAEEWAKRIENSKEPWADLVRLIQQDACLPHMCRDGHEEVRHSSDTEMCPVCKWKSIADNLAEEIELEGFSHKSGSYRTWSGMSKFEELCQKHLS